MSCAAARTSPSRAPGRQVLKMARSLVDVVTGDFRLAEKHDAYHNALEQVVAARLESHAEGNEGR